MAEIPETTTALRDWLRDLKEKSGLSYAAIAQAVEEEERVVKRWFALEKPSVPGGVSLIRCLDALGVELSPGLPESLPRALNAELRALRQTLSGQVIFSPSLAALDEREIEIWEAWLAVMAGLEPLDEQLVSRFGFDSEDDLQASFWETVISIFKDPENARAWTSLDGYMRQAMEVAAYRLAGGQGEAAVAAIPRSERLDRELLRDVAAEVVHEIREQIVPDLDDVRDRVTRLEEAAVREEEDPPAVEDGP